MAKKYTYKKEATKIFAAINEGIKLNHDTRMMVDCLSKMITIDSDNSIFDQKEITSQQVDLLMANDAPYHTQADYKFLVDWIDEYIENNF